MVETLTDRNYEAFLKKNKIAVVLVGADFCPPCKKVLSFLEKEAKKQKEVAFGYINVDKQKMQAFTKYGIVHRIDFADGGYLYTAGDMPLLIYYLYGTERKRQIGMPEKQTFQKTIDDLLARSA